MVAERTAETHALHIYPKMGARTATPPSPLSAGLPRRYSTTATPLAAAVVLWIVRLRRTGTHFKLHEFPDKV